VAFLVSGCRQSNTELDTATTRESARGLYSVEYTSRPQPPPLNTLHDWTLNVRTREGEAVTDAAIDVRGGMPIHTHGLPTQPAVVELGGGQYRVEGMKFHMPGDWQITLTIDSSAGTDSVTFDFRVK
jgi:hypothetical protein